MTPERQNELLKRALQLLVERCPRLVQSCYYALSRDLAPYDDVSAESAVRSRDELLQWLKRG